MDGPLQEIMPVHVSSKFRRMKNAKAAEKAHWAALDLHEELLKQYAEEEEEAKKAAEQPKKRMSFVEAREQRRAEEKLRQQQ